MEFHNSSPIYLQVISSIKAKIVRGELEPGDKLPSTRELAVEYHINPNTSARIYSEMESLGICFTKRGLGTFVTEDNDTIQQIREASAKELTVNYMQGMRSMGFDDQSMIAYINDYLKTCKE